MTITQNLADLVSIGITTKNRWQDLKNTLTKIKEVGLGALPILIFDDASDETCPFSLSDLSLQIKLKRFTESKGLIVRRNQIAQEIQTKYYLSLDDDSYPVSGSLEAAIAFAESLDKLLCLSFPIYNPVLAKYQNQSFGTHPYQVRGFVGCGHLLHRERFIQLGGYCEELIHQGEEIEIAARAFQQSWYCYHFPQFLIHHTASNTGRNWHRMDFYGARNNVLWNDWFVPQQLKLIKQVRTLVSRLSLGIKVKRWGQFQGECAGFRDIMQFKHYRHNMSMQCYKQWQTLSQS
ncbi:MAG: glycosyltransferase family 2 protein [Aulosira sp. ZfuVER01]|nr:glycosyltransferase [Aulosira sp. ZfuVER01]MDZ7997752.1 glycosyltransferase [Aulosira sp. DedVER01a]MDZ8052247.1 glycosyltransferase [Aulosira sp. ZfuCHP01]